MKSITTSAAVIVYQNRWSVSSTGHTGLFMRTRNEWVKVEFRAVDKIKTLTSGLILVSVPGSVESVRYSEDRVVEYLKTECSNYVTAVSGYDQRYNDNLVVEIVQSETPKYSVFGYNCRDYCLSVLRYLRRIGCVVSDQAFTLLISITPTNFVGVGGLIAAIAIIGVVSEFLRI